MYDPHKDMPGGFSQSDGTIDFYLRIRALLPEQARVVDLGAGRAAWFEDDNIKTRREVRHLVPSVRELIAVDVDPVVEENRACTSAEVYDGLALPLDDASVDMVVADYVLEHIDDPEAFRREIERVLKPGGYFCARTPHKYNYVSIAARLVKNESHQRVLTRIQPDRKAMDVFPTRYRLNKIGDIKQAFSGFRDCSFLYRSDPAYFFGSRLAFAGLKFLHLVAPTFLIGNIHVFMQKDQ